MTRVFLYFTLFLLFAASACQQSKMFSRTDESRIEGMVLDSEGLPLSGIMAEAGDHQVETDSQGRFTMDAVRHGSILFRLHGAFGTGQYMKNISRSRETLELEYPVMTTIILLHDNDLHFNFNHTEAFDSLLNEIRGKYDNVWMMNAGDTFVRHAHRWIVEDTSYYADRSLYMFETKNKLGYDLVTPGNHELDYVGTHTGVSLESAQFPLIAANIDIATKHLTVLKPYIVLETTNALSIAVLGLSTVNFNKPGVTSRDPVATTEAYRNLSDEYDMFMALTHIGYSSDSTLAEAVPDLDVIIGGHSHTLLETARVVNGVLIAQAGGPPPQHGIDPDWPKYLGKVKVVFENDTIIEKTGYVMTID